MPEEDKQEAKAHAQSAGREAKKAAKEAAEATHIATAPVVNEIEGNANKAMKAAKRVNVQGLTEIAVDAGVGFFALAVSIYAGAIAFNKFSDAFQGRHLVVQPAAKGVRYLRSDKPI